MRLPRRTKLQMANNLDAMLRERSRNFAKLRWQADQKGREWTLTRDQYLWVLSFPCAYGQMGEPQGIKMTLDRLNNTKGYTIDNVCPACFWHNRLRSNMFTFEEFKDAVGRYPGIRLCKNKGPNAE